MEKHICSRFVNSQPSQNRFFHSLQNNNKTLCFLFFLWNTNKSFTNKLYIANSFCVCNQNKTNILIRIFC